MLVAGCNGGTTTNGDCSDVEADLAACENEVESLEDEIAALKAPVEPIEWRVAYWGGPGSSPSIMQWWIDEMTARTDGRFTAELHLGGVLAPGPETIDGVKAGLFEMGHVFTNWHPGKTPMSEGTSLPFIGPQEQMETWMWLYLINQTDTIKAEFAEWNCRIDVVPVGSGGFEIMSEWPILSVDDFDGLRIEVGGLMGEAFVAYGATPTDFEIPEMYEAHDKGLLDANCGGWPGLFGMLKLYELLPHATTGVTPGTVHPVWMTGIDAWAALPDEVRGVHWEELSPLIFEKSIEVTNEYNDAYFAEMEAFGTEMHQLPPAERQKLKDVSQATYDEWAEAREAEGRAGSEFIEMMIAASAWATARY
jgi:TRAP-type C4-dicarboxylate transport system substrate-binding protein